MTIVFPDDTLSIKPTANNHEEDDPDSNFLDVIAKEWKAFEEENRAYDVAC